MKWTKPLFVAVSLGMLMLMGCGDKDPVSSTGEGDGSLPAAKLTISNRVASTCDGAFWRCRPGFGGGSVTFRPDVPPPPEPIRTRISFVDDNGSTFVIDEDGSDLVPTQA